MRPFRVLIPSTAQEENMTVKTMTAVEKIMRNRPGGIIDHLQEVGGSLLVCVGAGILGGPGATLLVAGLLLYLDIRIDDLVEAAAS
jgi:hypothetical protein